MSYFPSVAFLTGSVGSGEWIVLFVVILIVVGPRRMPEVARKIGRMMEMFRRAADEFKDQLMTMDQEHPPAPPADAGGVSSLGAEEGGAAAPYDDGYSAMSAAYPGNEEQAGEAPADVLPDSLPPEDPVPAPEPEKPAEGGA